MEAPAVAVVSCTESGPSSYLPGAGRKPISPHWASTVSVLVVDDQSSVREFLHDVLVRAGYRVTLIGDGQEALRLAHADPPQVVLTDLSMRPLGGLELIAELQRAAPSAVFMCALCGSRSSATARSSRHDKRCSAKVRPVGSSSLCR